MANMKKAIVIHPKDNVASLLSDVKRNDIVHVSLGEESFEIKVREPVHFGHKFSLREIPKGEHVIKYGEVIGFATKDIEKGCHVHVQNVESYRGRGDRA